VTRRSGSRPKASANATREQRARAQAAGRRRHRRFTIVLTAVVVVAVVGTGLAVVAAQHQSAASHRPAGVTTAGGGVSVGPASAPVMDLYEDYQCPACKDFESAMGSIVEELVSQGKLRVVYHPLSFLDTNLRNTSSALAAAAAGCAQDQVAYVKFHDIVFAKQPRNAGAGFTIADIMDFGRQAGVKDQAAFESCVNGSRYNVWVADVQKKADAVPITAALTIMLNGKTLDLSSLTPESLTTDVAAAADAHPSSS
jgi:protein-disulfide isomerase